ncbi:MAG: serine/threonine protein kinase [Kofleriaceae bacterium]|nr:serine/threonine protein kinase [Kofleriaceae bacterium]
MITDCIEAGTMVGEYQIVEPIGEGGMGEVYLAIHPVIGKRAAVKVLRTELARDQELVDRFVAEARAVNSIEHSNIIDVFAFGQLQDGRQYYLMEYLDGVSLEELLEENGRLEFASFLPIAQQVADALDAAHEHGIIHRDLKPENIYLVPKRGGGHRVVILDFGIAKLSSAPSTTSSGLVLGTPHYMSPEQCMGVEIDSRSDLYAFATICYRALAGRLPFDGTEVQQVMYQQTTEAPAAPSSFGSAPRFDRPLLQGLSKEAESRQDTLRELVEELVLVQSAKAIPTQVRGAPYALPSWKESPIVREELHDDTEAVRMSFAPAKGKGRERKKPKSPGRTTACMNATAPIRLSGHNQYMVQCIAYCPAGGILASAGDDHVVRLWSYSGREVVALRRHTDKVEKLCFSPHGHLLASAGGDGKVVVWSVYGGDVLREFTGHRGRVNALEFSPDGKQLLSGGSDGSVRLWTIATGHCQVMGAQSTPVRAVAFSPMGNAVAFAGDDKVVRLWKDESGERTILAGHTRTVYSVCFSPDGQTLASGGHDGTVIEWRIRDGRSRVHNGHNGIVWHVQYSPDASLLVSSSSDGTAKLWRKSGTCLTLEGHGRRVRNATFSPDGTVVATAGLDGTVRLWETKNGRCKSILSHSGPARSVAFTPAGDWVASSSGKSSLIMTPISESEIADARSKA